MGTKCLENKWYCAIYRSFKTDNIPFLGRLESHSCFTGFFAELDTAVDLDFLYLTFSGLAGTSSTSFKGDALSLKKDIKIGSNWRNRPQIRPLDISFTIVACEVMRLSSLLALTCASAPCNDAATTFFVKFILKRHNSMNTVKKKEN